MSSRQSSLSTRDLRFYLAVLRRHKLPIILVTGVTLAAVVAYTLQQTPRYTSTTRVLVRSVGVNSWNYRLETADMPTESAVARSEPVAAVVAQNIGSQDKLAHLLSGLHVSIVADTAFLDFAYTDPQPQEAQRMSQAFADAYIGYRTQLAEDMVKQLRGPIDDEISASMDSLRRVTKALGNVDPSRTLYITNLSSDKAYIEGRIGYLKQQLLPYDQAATNGGDVMTAAGLPTSPSSPSYPRNLELGLIAGLALGMSVAFVRDRLDDRLRGSRDLDQRMGAPILATIPKIPTWKKRELAVMITSEAPKGPVAESYRTLRTNLQFIASDKGLRVMMVTSPAAGEGKTVTVANLAATLAQTGKRVIAVSCDLRKPRLHHFFGLSNKEGVTSVLAGSSSLPQAAQKPAGFDTLRILASGPTPPNPAELLGSAAMDALVVDLRAYADFVIIDTPPVLAVSDALILSSKSDAVLVVADAESTPRTTITHTREQLTQMGANLIGCILNNFDPTQMRYYPYTGSYYYYGSYGYTSHDAESASVDADPNGHKKAAQESAAPEGGKATRTDEGMWHP